MKWLEGALDPGARLQRGVREVLGMVLGMVLGVMLTAVMIGPAHPVTLLHPYFRKIRNLKN